MKHLYSIFTLFLLVNISLIAQQPDSVRATLNEMVITATKTETPYYAIGSSVSVITSKEISERNLKTVVDVLREEPGLSVIEQGGPGKLAYVFMRGSNTNHTLVVVDGVTMNDASSPNNAFDFSSMNTNDVDRIEIVRGPQSTLYGSDALAGIINIITKRGSGKPEYSFSSEGGTNGYYRGNLSALGSLGILNFAISASKSGTDGVSASDAQFGNQEKDGNKNNSFTGRLGLDLTRRTKLDFIYKFSRTETSLDQSEKFGDDPNYIYNIEEHLFLGGIKASVIDNVWLQQFNASFIKRFNHSLDLTDALHLSLSSDSYNLASRIKLSWQNNLRIIENNLITFGIESENETARTSYYSTSEWGPFDSVFPEQSIRTTAFYIQDQINIANSFFTSVGVRHDENQKFGGVTTFRIAPAYYFGSTGTKIKMSFGTGFKAPSLFYLFDPMFGNPDLKPEKSRGWDFGIDQNFADGRFNVSVTYFNLKLKNMFGFDSNFRTVNIAEASSKGFEISASAIDLRKFTINANYTYMITNDEFSLSPDFDKPLLRRPRDQFSIAANYRLNEKLNLNLQLRYVGERDDKDFSAYPAARVTLSDYTLVNLAGSYKILDFVELTARVENLFDRKYEEVLYYGTLGRSFCVGMNLSL